MDNTFKRFHRPKYIEDALLKIKPFLRRVLILHTPNPGWNHTALITLGGVALMGVSFILHQFGFGPVDPTIIEIGKAAFYTGLGRATMPTKGE